MMKLNTAIVALIFSSFLQTLLAQTVDLKSFMFGHSLIDHRPPVIPTPSNETTIPHWIYLLAQEAGHSYQAAGQYGFLPQHANLPPFSQWGYDIVPPAWDSDNEPFSAVGFNNVLITAGNFVQWQPSNEPYPGEGSTSPLSATLDIGDWVNQEAPNATIYIYENWPDMAPYLSNGFPPTTQEFANYNAYTIGDFHNWWIDYHDFVLAARPNLNVRMIPVGPILEELLTTTLSQTPITELYEDDAPHGRATIYFLAGLVTYMAIYEEVAPATYNVPNIVHEDVRNNYSSIVNTMWSELQNFNDENGDSRVFTSTALPMAITHFEAVEEGNTVRLFWEMTTDLKADFFEIEYSTNGMDFRKIGEEAAASPLGYTFLHQYPQAGKNYYRLKQIEADNRFMYSQIVSVDVRAEEMIVGDIFPNPSSDGVVQLDIFSPDRTLIVISIFDTKGQLLREETRYLTRGNNELYMDYSQLGEGLFLIKMKTEEEVCIKKLLIR